MNHLREQLQAILQGRVCVVGMGNVECGDDWFGVRLAERLNDLPLAHDDLRVVVAGREPEHYLGEMSNGEFDNVAFLDAVEFSGEPGAVVLLNSTEMRARFPQVSTHRLSVGLLARILEAGGNTKAWLLGVQPASLKAEEELSPAVRASLDLLAEILSGVFRSRLAAQGAPKVCQCARSAPASLRAPPWELRPNDATHPEGGRVGQKRRGNLPAPFQGAVHNSRPVNQGGAFAGLIHWPIVGVPKTTAPAHPTLNLDLRSC